MQKQQTGQQQQMNKIEEQMAGTNRNVNTRTIREKWQVESAEGVAYNAQYLW